MRPLHLDFHPRATALSRLGFALCAIALALIVYLLLSFVSLNAEQENLEAKWAGLQGKKRNQASRSLKSADFARLKAEFQRANEVVDRLAAPWDALFKAVESAGSEDVALLGIQPDPEKRLVKIDAEAKDFSAMLEYVKRLAREDVLDSVHIVSHQINQQDPQKPVRFVAIASWAVPHPQD